MADQETIKELLENKYFLFGLIGVGLILGQVVKRCMARLRDKMKDRLNPPQ